MIELIGDINLQNYMGEWLEIARKPNFFKKLVKTQRLNTH